MKHVSEPDAPISVMHEMECIHSLLIYYGCKIYSAHSTLGYTEVDCVSDSSCSYALYPAKKPTVQTAKFVAKQRQEE